MRASLFHLRFPSYWTAYTVCTFFGVLSDKARSEPSYSSYTTQHPSLEWANQHTITQPIQSKKKTKGDARRAKKEKLQ